MLAKNTLTPTYTLSFCNSYCELLAVYIPQIDTAVITIYRPPNCGTNKFQEVIDKCVKWSDKLGLDNISPRYIINGDFNFPYMNGWDDSDIDSLISLLEASVISRFISSFALSVDPLPSSLVFLQTDVTLLWFAISLDTRVTMENLEFYI